MRNIGTNGLPGADHEDVRVLASIELLLKMACGGGVAGRGQAQSDRHRWRRRGRVAAALPQHRRGAVDPPRRHRAGLGHGVGGGGLPPRLRQPPSCRRLFRPDADAVPKRRKQPRTGHRQGRQSPAAPGDARIGVAVAALPARQPERRTAITNPPGRFPRPKMVQPTTGRARLKNSVMPRA